jgi:outer membrane cobalamin receptor
MLFDVHGVVVDPAGRLVEGAMVRCSGQTSSTNQQGSFRFPDSSGCEAKISKSGFSEQTVTLGSTKDNQVTLKIAPTSDRVVVSAGGAPVALEEAGVAAEIFTAQDLEVRQYAPVSDVLRDVAGLNVVQTGSGGGLISVFSRGGDSKAGLVLLDGVPLTAPGGELDYVSLTTPGIERIEVVRGPESALFGAEASSGVIQMFTKQGDPETAKPHGTLAYDRGSFSSDHWSAGLDGGLGGKLDYALIADQYRTTGEFPNNAFRNTTGTANVGFHFSDKTSLRAIYRMWDSYTGTPGQTYYNLFDLHADQLARDSALTVRVDDTRGQRYTQHAYVSYHRNRTRSIDTNLDSDTAAALVTTVPASGPGTFDRTYLVRLVPPSTTTADPGTTLVTSSTFPFPYDSLSLTSRTSGAYEGIVTHRGGAFVAGYEFERQAGLISTFDVDRQNHGISLFDQYAVGRNIFLSGGARIEHSSIFGSRIAPRGAVSFRLPTDTYFRVSLSRGILEPTLVASFAREQYYMGNPNLRPEKTDSFEAGLLREWFGRRLRTEASYFRNRYQDLIEYDSSVFPGTFENINRAWSRGLELTTSIRLREAVSLRGGYTYLRTRVVSSATTSQIGTELLRRPRNSGSVGLQITPRRWTFLIGARFVGERADNDFFFGVNRNPAYQYAYLSGSFQINKHIAPYVRVNNLSDEWYQEALGYAAWGRNATGGVRVTW